MNLELKTVNSRNSGIWQLHRLTGAVAPLGRARRLSPWAVLPLSGAVAPPSQNSEIEPWAMPPSTQAVPPLAKSSGSEWADPFGPIWVYQGPNCLKIKLMGSPLISNLIIMLTTIFLKTFTATCSGVSIASSGELPANFRRLSDEPLVMLLRTSDKLLDLR